MGADRADAVLAETFRNEAARISASLARLSGGIDLAEEVLQETLVAALEHWRRDGVPDNPSAWLLAVARNRALDRLRRTRREKGARNRMAKETPETAPPLEPEAGEEGVPDDRLRLMFLCCHPALAPEVRVALALRLVAGLSTAEIARAFLTTEATVAQRIVRAKRALSRTRARFEMPPPAELPERMAAVLASIYLLFNEGYAPRAGNDVTRSDLAAEAIRLGWLLAGLAPGEGEVHGLLALMELQASRITARADAEGNPVLLESQDRARWDRARIARGFERLERARRMPPPGPYALQAEIAACHAAAPTWEETDWRRIAAIYDLLREAAPSPVVDLNRAVAVGMARGPTAGLAALDLLAGSDTLRDYPLLPTARAEFLRRAGRPAEAADELRRALAITRNARDRAVLEDRLRGVVGAP